jgi:hypothetical protein
MGTAGGQRAEAGVRADGSPEHANGTAVFTSFDDGAQVAAWRSLVGQVATRYVAQFGAAEVRRWNFETWNEIKNHDWDQTSFTPLGFRNYYGRLRGGAGRCRPAPPLRWTGQLQVQRRAAQPTTASRC